MQKQSLVKPKQLDTTSEVHGERKKNVKQKVSLEVKSIVALIIAVIAARGMLFYLPEVKPYIGEYAYDYVTNDFSEKNVEQLESDILANNNVSLYYIGRGSCSDCRETVRNVKQLKDLSENSYNIPMYYVKLADEISDKERAFLDSIDVDGIPTLVLVRYENTKQFGLYDITAANFVGKFKEFIQ